MSTLKTVVQALKETTEIWDCHITGTPFRLDELSKLMELRAIIQDARGRWNRHHEIGV